MESIKGILLDAQKMTAEVIEFDDIPGRDSELMECIFTDGLKRRVEGKRYLFTISSDMSGALVYDDKMGGIRGNSIITDVDAYGNKVSLSDNDITMWQMQLKKEGLAFTN